MLTQRVLMQDMLVIDAAPSAEAITNANGECAQEPNSSFTGSKLCLLNSSLPSSAFDCTYFWAAAA